MLSWARQLSIESDARRIQGHHRLSGADRSVALYSRDDIIPMVRLQARVVAAFRSGFRPLQPVARGLVAPLDDFPVVLPIRFVALFGLGCIAARLSSRCARPASRDEPPCTCRFSSTSAHATRSVCSCV